MKRWLFRYWKLLRQCLLRLWRIYHNPIAVGGVAEIRSASLNIEGALLALTKKITPKKEIEVILDVAIQNRRIQAGLRMLRKEGL